QDVIIAVSGAPKKEFMERRVGGVIEGAMQHRQTVVVNDVEGEKPFPGTLLFDDDDDRRVAAYIAAPIVVGGEAIGSVILCTREPDRKMGDLDRTLVETAATFLARQMQ